MEQQLGKYEILEVLGSGSRSVVYKARDSVLQRLVALKVLNDRWPDGHPARAAFQAKMTETANLIHPNVVVLHDHGIEIDRPFIAMEVLEGRDLKDLFEENYPFNLAQKLDIALQIARAMQHAQDQGLPHGSLKPANLFVLQDGTVKVTDFSLPQQPMTDTGQQDQPSVIAEDMAHRSPEQIRGEATTSASDVFSFGTVLFELFTYTKLFDAQNESVVAFQILSDEEPLDLSSVPEGLQDLLDGCLKRSLEERTESFEAIALELDRVRGLVGAERSTLDPDSDAAAPPSPPVRPRPMPAVISPVRPSEVKAEAGPKVYLQRPVAPSPVRHGTPEYVPPPRSLRSSLVLAAGSAVLLTLIASVAIIVTEPGWLGVEGTASVRMVKDFFLDLLPREQPTPRPVQMPTPTKKGAKSGANSSGKSAGKSTAVPAASPGAAASLPAAQDIPIDRWEPGKPARVLLPNQVPLDLVWIPSGQYRRGCSEGDADCNNDEDPTHQVTLNGFWLGQSEVTQAQWSAVQGSNPGEPKGETLPVNRVSLEQARAFVGKAGFEFRLPTEAEWEYAARGGKSTAQYAPLESAAWTLDNSGSELHPVAQKTANAYGLHDMLGNLWEWCDDPFGRYPSDAVTNPRQTAGEYAVSRGGSFTRAGRYARVSARYALKPEFSAADLGFRVARSGPSN